MMLFLTALSVFGIVSIPFLKKGGNEMHAEKVNPAFSEYISAFTSGYISNQSTIRIILSSENPNEVEFNKAVEEELFEFSPSIKGTTVWVDNRTIEFRPEGKLPSGQNYEATFHLEKVTDVPAEFEDFDFYFTVITQSFEVYFDGMKTTDKKNMVWQKLLGMITTADIADNEEVEKMITATQNGKKLKVYWEHAKENKHRFVVDSVERKEKQQEVIFKWNGSPIGVSLENTLTFNIPALGDFKVMEIKVVQEPEQYVSVLLSDPLLENQNLAGLIRETSNNASFKYIIEDNEIKAYPLTRQSGIRTISVEPGIKNILGYALKDKMSMEVVFEELKPQVKLLGKGVILPSTNEGFVLPFEAVSVRAVDVKVIKIFEDNISQFMQVNNIGGERELKRVGRLILKKTVKLNAKSELDYHKWNTYYLDLAELVKTEPGAIYKVTIGFRKQNSVYRCEGDSAANKNLDEIAKAEELDNIHEYDSPQEYYSYYGDYYNDYYEGEEGGENDPNSPCSDRYYTKRRDVSRNILASDLGVIAKKGTNGQYTFLVTDLKNTKPQSGVSIELMNYQQQVIATLKTDGNGMAQLEGMKKVPFLLVAKNGSQRGYLKLDDGSSLSLSMFDVGGASIQKGIKGFIYGERGVWRPGDSLFLSFVVEDKEKKLPANHPVTFELINPRWQTVKKITKNDGVNGVYNFSTVTDREAPTGNWTARINVGGASFSKDLKIETIMPNRLKLRFDFGTDKISYYSKNVKGDLEVKWLHGAIAKNLASKVDVTLSEQTTSFKGYDNFIFDDPTEHFDTEQQTIFDSRLNEEGKASIVPNISVKDAAPGMLRASFVARVFEEGGSFSIDRFSLPYSPYASYVGMDAPDGEKYSGMLVTDTNHIVKVVTVDEDGKPISRSKITVKVYKVKWRWWWDDYDDDLGEYVGNEYHQPYDTKEISTTNGKGQFILRVNRPDWGRFFIRVTDEESGHSTGQTVYIDWPYWAGKSNKGDNTGATVLAFNSDKEKYNVGDEVKLSIPSGEGGRALISLETGSKVLNAFWAETKKGTTEVKFLVTPEMAPNIYASVTLIQPHANTKNDLPIRMYGVIPISVEDPNTHLRPLIQSAEVFRPETKTSITVSEENGKPMTYTLAVVDEGLLDLTRFETPNPWKHFYAREALGVKTWDVFDNVMGAWGAALQQLLAIGGDGEGEGKGGAKANRFKPMVKFFGPFSIDKGQKKTTEFMMPQYVGSVRVMVVARDIPRGGKNEAFAYGSNDKTVAVKTPLMILATLPRVVGPNEIVDLPVTVFAMEKNVKNVTVEVKANNFFVALDGTKKNISFSDIGDEVITFPLKVNPKLGVGKVTVTATSGKEKATYDIEIEVRNPNPKVTDVIETVIEPGKSWSADYKAVGMAGTNTGVLEISNIPPVNLDYRLKYLLQYPHGCVEQTTSSVFPQVYLTDIMELNSDYKATIDRNIKAGIKRLHGFQTGSGGFSYWPGYYEADDWGSTYAGHFLVEAELKGYALPAGMLDAWKKYQKKLANAWTYKSKNHRYYYYNDDLQQAYRLYTLALAKSPELGAMNRLRESADLSSAAKWRLAAAYSLASQPEVAKQMITNVPVMVAKYSEMSYSYGSSDRDEAMIVEALCTIGEFAKAAPVVKELSIALSNNSYWMSTQSTAYCLIAISRFAKQGGASGTMGYSYSINGSAVQEKNTKLPLSQIPVEIKGTDGGKVSVTNSGKGILYARLVLQGVPEEGDKTSAENNLKLNINYKNMDRTSIDVSNLEQGTDFYAEVTITNPGYRGWYKEMALTQIFPSGWEIHNTRMDESQSALKSDVPTYQDIRDDRVYTYFNIGAGKTMTFHVILNAAYIGKFYLPTVACEAMYDNTVSARKPGEWVEIKKPGLP